MHIIFCSDDLDRRKPDQAYEAEVAALETVGGHYSLINLGALANDGDAGKAVRRVPEQSEPSLAIYRGWMLKPSVYALLYEALTARNVCLINNPAAYVHCHHLPESYSVIQDCTPRSVWLKTGSEVDVDAIMELLRPFGAAPLVLKDFVKSQKHDWHEACFIPSASDRSAVERVVRRFLDLTDDDLNEGLVFREFVEFEPLARHSKSGMPLTKEFRLFFLDGKPVFWIEYWEEGNYAGLAPPLDQFIKIAAGVKSRFFTMDIAKRQDGGWLIVELGDAQVAGLPENADVEGFYRAIMALSANSSSRRSAAG
jgi:hypothetical protein